MGRHEGSFVFRVVSNPRFAGVGNIPKLSGRVRVDANILEPDSGRCDHPHGQATARAENESCE